MRQNRALFRFAIERNGQLSRESDVASCRVKDLTQNGVRLETALLVHAGDTLDLAFDLTPTRRFQCGIQVVAGNGSFLGARF